MKNNAAITGNVVREESLPGYLRIPWGKWHEQLSCQRRSDGSHCGISAEYTFWNLWRRRLLCHQTPHGILDLIYDTYDANNGLSSKGDFSQ